MFENLRKYKLFANLKICQFYKNESFILKIYYIGSKSRNKRQKNKASKKFT